MTATKSASLESKQYFDEHKETTKSALHKISAKKDLSDKQKKALTNLLLDEVKEKQGTDDFKKHSEIRKADYKKIRELVIQRVGDPKKVKKEDIQDAIDFFYGKSEKKESKETLIKSLEFEKDTFKIPNESFKEVTRKSARKNPALKKFLNQGIKVKANATLDVVEYMEDRVNGESICKKGEQLFLFDYNVKSERDRFFGYIAAAKCCPIEEVESRFSMTVKELEEKMKDKPSHSEEYKEFFYEEVDSHLAGYFDPDIEGFYFIGRLSYVYLAGGYYAHFDQNEWDRNTDSRNCGFSVRLLKN